MQNLWPEATTLLLATSGLPRAPFLLTPAELHPTGDAREPRPDSPRLCNSPHSLGFLRKRREFVCLSLTIIDLFLPNRALNLDSLGYRQEVWGCELREVYC